MKIVYQKIVLTLTNITLVSTVFDYAKLLLNSLNKIRDVIDVVPPNIFHGYSISKNDYI